MRSATRCSPCCRTPSVPAGTPGTTPTRSSRPAVTPPWSTSARSVTATEPPSALSSRPSARPRKGTARSFITTISRDVRRAAEHVRRRGRGEEMQHRGEHNGCEVVEVRQVDGGTEEDEEEPEGRRLGEGVQPAEGIGEPHDADGRQENEKCAQQRQ